MLRGLSLFSGIGGIDYALKDYVKPIAYCEIEPYAAAVLFNLMLNEKLPAAPVFPDIGQLSSDILPAGIDIIYGGFPCTNISNCGDKKGLDGKQSQLFFEVVRLTGEIRPRLVFLENVPAIVNRGLSAVCGEFCKIGYDSKWTILSAAEVGAWHQRKRWWFLAHIDSEGLEGGVSPESERFPAWKIKSPWSSEPDMGRMVHGVPRRMDRIKALGNAVVPQCAQAAFEMLIGM